MDSHCRLAICTPLRQRKQQRLDLYCTYTMYVRRPRSHHRAAFFLDPPGRHRYSPGCKVLLFTQAAVTKLRHVSARWPGPCDCSSVGPVTLALYRAPRNSPKQLAFVSCSRYAAELGNCICMLLPSRGVEGRVVSQRAGRQRLCSQMRQ